MSFDSILRLICLSFAPFVSSVVLLINFLYLPSLCAFVNIYFIPFCVLVSSLCFLSFCTTCVKFVSPPLSVVSVFLFYFGDCCFCVRFHFLRLVFPIGINCPYTCFISPRYLRMHILSESPLVLCLIIPSACVFSCCMSPRRFFAFELSAPA